MNTATRLEVTTPSDLEIVMSRTFNAPRRMVWEAMTTPDLMRRWLFSPPGWTMTECVMDVSVGGKYRWTWTGPDGRHAMTISCLHKVVNPPAKLVHTELMEMGPGAGECGGGDGDAGGAPWELVATLDFTERG